MRKRYYLLICTLAGVLNGLWMLVLHSKYQKLGGVCAVNERISCEVLTFKQYSEWWGVPTPLYALFVFLLLFTFAFRAWKGWPKDQQKEDAYGWLLSTLSLGAALGMAYISFFILKKLCVFCFLFYIIIIATWILYYKVIGGQFSKNLKTAFSDCYRNKWVWFVGATFVSVISLAHVAFEKTGRLTGEAVNIGGDEIRTSGNPQARVSIAVFSDFQCPHCKHMAEVMRKIEEDFGSDVKITYKFYPLDPSCNEGAPWGQHRMACQAAVAAVCAGQQGKFWRYHDKLFENQDSLSQDLFHDIAKHENMDLQKFDTCLVSSAAMEMVVKDTEEGTRLQIPGTPAVFFNGKRFEGEISKSAIAKMIQEPN